MWQVFEKAWGVRDVDSNTVEYFDDGPINE